MNQWRARKDCARAAAALRRRLRRSNSFPALVSVRAGCRYGESPDWLEMIIVMDTLRAGMGWQGASPALPKSARTRVTA